MTRNILSGQINAVIGIGLGDVIFRWLRNLVIPCAAYAGFGTAAVKTSRNDTIRAGVNALAEQGCRRIGLWRPVLPYQPNNLESGRDKREVGTFVEALQQHGLPLEIGQVRQPLNLLTGERHETTVTLQEQGYLMATYFVDGNLIRSGTLTIDNIWTAGEYDASTWKSRFRNDSAMAHAFGIKTIAYEGGPHNERNFPNSQITQAEADNPNQVKEQARADARMTPEIVEHHQAWSDYGGDLVMYFQSSSEWQFGFTQNIFDLNTPSYAAVDQLHANTRTEPTVGTLLPASASVTILGKDWATNNNSPSSTGTSSPVLKPGNATTYPNKPNLQWVSYPVRGDGSATTMAYWVRVNYTSTTGGTLEVWFDGVKVGTITVAANSSNVTSSDFAVAVGKGLHGLRVVATGTNDKAITVNSVTLVK